MLPAARQTYILEMLRKNKQVQVSELSALLGVSDMSCRRDLLKLEQAGLLKRTFGGAVLAPNVYALEVSFAEKETDHAREKRAIAVAAAHLIRSEETVALGAGTTTLQLARHIGAHRRVTVVTNALNLAMALAGRRDISLIVTGGSLQEESFALVGPFAEALFRHIHVNKLFIGANGISTVHGATTLDLQEASIYRAMMAVTDETVVVADSSKFGRTSLAQITDLGEVRRIVTDPGISALQQRELEQRGIEVIVASYEGTEQ